MPERTPLHDLELEQGAVFTDDAGWEVPAHFGDALAEYRAAHEGAVLFDLSHRGKVEVAGPDAATFLHNLSSNDVKSLTPGAGCEAFFLTAKARVVAHVFISRLASTDDPLFWLDSEPCVRERLYKHLERHLISERVELAYRSRDFAQLYVAGLDARAMLARPECAALEPLRHCEQPPGDQPQRVRRRDVLGVPGFDVFCRAEDAANVWQGLFRKGARPAGLDAFQILRVEGGYPLQGVDIDDERAVMEVGRTRQAISYTKGCFPGQEPIVMARDRGHVNRTLLGLKVAGEGPVAAGSKLFRDGQEVGLATSSAVSPRLGPIALAYVRRGHQEPGTLVEVETETGRRRAEVSSLPFSGGEPG